MRYLFTLIFIMLWSFCGVTQTLITYQTSTNDFANPERGFYRYSATHSDNYNLLNATTLASYRQLHMPFGANYSIYSTLVFRYFFLDDFTASPISQSYLDNMQLDFDAARQAGVKLIPRFAYTNEVDGTTCASWICPPYGDASKNWVLSHINQIKPLLEVNKDVIAVVQMGFIGVWGENYYTDYFGDASQAPDYKLTDNNWNDRIEVLNALLDAVPNERMVQVRYPQMKQRTIYGVNALTNSNALTLSEAHLGSNKSRLGFHNDCLLASTTDFGTYSDYGNSSSGSISDTTNLKPYFEEDSQFVVVGGETCNDDFSPQNNCASSDPLAYGDTEIARMHYSYLNAQYNNEVNNDWVTDGCMEDIKKRLGYRLELQNGTYSNSVQQGQTIDVNIDLKNVGYAAPYNERRLELILRNTLTLDLWYAHLPHDPRFWLADNSLHNITERLCIGNDMPLGNYELLLHLADPMPLLYGTPSYAIRLANLLPDNSDVWESLTGFNKLGHVITIDNSSSNSLCNGEITFTSTPSLPVELIHFNATANPDHISLQWSTNTETNNLVFYVERSVNGIDFHEIKKVNGQGTSNQIHHYEIDDFEVRKNISYYYRLAQIDYDGTINYSKIITAKITPKLNFQDHSLDIYPNPSTKMCYVASDHHSIEEINLLNVNGKNLKSSVSISRINQKQLELDLSTLNPGIYFLQIKLNNQLLTRKIWRI